MNRDLLLVEDLMLLLLDDTSGSLKGAGTIHYTLGGAMLIDLALRGRVEIDEGQTVTAIPGEPLDDPLLQAAVETTLKRPRYVQTSLIELGSTLRADVMKRLIERGLIAEEKSKMLGFIPVTKTPAQDAAYEAALLESVRAVLEDGAEPTERTGALAALLSASGTLPEFHPAIRWGNDVATRGFALQRGDWGATAVNTAIMQQIMATGIALAVAVAAGSVAGNQAQ